jgi:hypothetical protein
MPAGRPSAQRLPRHAGFGEQNRFFVLTAHWDFLQGVLRRGLRTLRAAAPTMELNQSIRCTECSAALEGAARGTPLPPLAAWPAAAPAAPPAERSCNYLRAVSVCGCLKFTVCARAVLDLMRIWPCSNLAHSRLYDALMAKGRCRAFQTQPPDLFGCGEISSTPGGSTPQKTSLIYKPINVYPRGPGVCDSCGRREARGGAGAGSSPPYLPCFFRPPQFWRVMPGNVFASLGNRVLCGYHLVCISLSLLCPFAAPSMCVM